MAFKVINVSPEVLHYVINMGVSGDGMGDGIPDLQASIIATSVEIK